MKQRGKTERLRIRQMQEEMKQEKKREKYPETTIWKVGRFLRKPQKILIIMYFMDKEQLPCNTRG